MENYKNRWFFFLLSHKCMFLKSVLTFLENLWITVINQARNLASCVFLWIHLCLYCGLWRYKALHVLPANLVLEHHWALLGVTKAIEAPAMQCGLLHAGHCGQQLQLRRSMLKEQLDLITLALLLFPSSGTEGVWLNSACLVYCWSCLLGTHTGQPSLTLLSHPKVLPAFTDRSCDLS